MKKFALYTLIAIIITSCSTRKNPLSKKVDLNGYWKFHQVNDTVYYPAKVPGNVFTDLLHAHQIKDPFYRSNEDSLQWISLNDWEYETQFSISKNQLKNQHINLGFEGLDTHAKVYLNSSLILVSNNMFRKYEIDIRNLIQANNKLRIVFKSPLHYIEERSKELGYELPEERVFSRKAPYQFGWDWGPKFITMGIWKPIYIESWESLKLEDIYYTTDSIKDNKAYLSAHFNIQSDYETDTKININHKSRKLKTQEVHLKATKNTISIPFEIENPQLWWSNGLGDAHLYNLKATLSENGQLIDSKTKDVGIRTIKLIQKKDEYGKSFYFELNGKAVFMKGANYIPQDNFLNRVNHEKYEKLIQSAVDANMNMLRVWGGGIYENDEFYDLCDQKGILIWQDFMFACAMYPGDSSFLGNVKQEAIDNIIRLRNHPSIALWCGNNEIDEAWKNWGWQKQFNYTEDQQSEIWKSYTDLFHELLPQLIQEYDPGRDYWASSPSIGWGHPESLTEGDSHYWGVWWGEQAFDIYEEKVGRFMSEYGFQGFPDPSTLDSVLLIEDLHLKSSALKTHQKHLRGFELIQTYMECDYNIPSDFQEYNYVSQLLQAEGIKLAIEAHRRAKPYCMGTLYWQLNDCWPVISWSSIDYYGNWKALHYQVKRSFEDVLISTEQKNDSLRIFIVSDLSGSFDGELSLKIMDFDGETHFNKRFLVQIPENSSKMYYKTSLTDLLYNLEQNNIVLSIELLSKGNKVTNATHYFDKVKKLELQKPKIQTKINEVADGYEIYIITDKPAKNIQLSIQEYNVRFSDNYFDLLPKQTKIIHLRSKLNIKKIRDNLEIKSLFNTRNP